jgi:spoIIIJ-associated protein
MAKGKDFYGDNVTAVIARACNEFSVSQDELDIEVLETGSAGIFGLCKKKAHIRVLRKSEKSAHAEQRKQPEAAKETVRENSRPEPEKEEAKPAVQNPEPQVEKEAEPKAKNNEKQKKIRTSDSRPAAVEKAGKETKKVAAARGAVAEPVERELPTDAVLTAINVEIVSLLEVMGFPSVVTVAMDNYTVACRISEEHQEVLVGRDGRTLDSLQYLLRKMMSRRLPDRMMLSLDVGDYRERRAGELKERALELAGQVKEDGKTQAIAALNPSERRVVHMILQEDKAIRSRSVGEGLFKKVLIYKPGKKKSGPRKGKGRGKGRQGGRPSGNR